MEESWNLEDIIWSLIPGTFRVGVREITPERINLPSAEDLRAFVKVFTGRPLCYAPEITSADATVSAGTGALDAGTYIYKFTTLTEHSDLIEETIFTGTELSAITKGLADTQDEFIPPVTPLVTSLRYVNQGGVWDGMLGIFVGGTNYDETTDWVFYVDDSVTPNKYYVDWVPTGDEPLPATTYNIVYEIQIYGESTPTSFVEVIVPSADSSVVWDTARKIDRSGAGIVVYRSAPIDSVTPYRSVVTPRRYVVTPTPTSWTDDGIDTDFSSDEPPENNTAFYDPDFLDPSITFDEIKNKIIKMADVIDLDVIPEQVLEYVFYALRSVLDPTKDTEEQVAEFRKRVDTIKIKSTIPSVMRILRKTRRELGTTINTSLDGVFEPYPYIAKYSHTGLSGNPVEVAYGNQVFGTLGKLQSTAPTILEDASGSGAFASAKEGHLIKMPFEGGKVEGFKIAKVIDDNHVEIPQAAIVWEDPRHRNKTDIESISFFLFVPLPRLDHLTDWPYWHHGVYEVRSTMNPDTYKDEIYDEVHPAGTRIWFAFFIELEEVIATGGDVVEANLGLIIQPTLKNYVCGARWSANPVMGAPAAKWSGCVAEREEMGLFIDMYSNDHLTVAMRRIPSWTPVLKFFDLSGVIGYLSGPDDPDPWSTQWVTNGYDFSNDPPYLDAQPPDEVEKVAFTGTTLPSIVKGIANGQDEFFPPTQVLVTSVVAINQGTPWDKPTGTFPGPVSYTENVDWVFYVDDSVFPHRFYIDWSPGGVEPAPASSYNIAYTMEIF